MIQDIEWVVGSFVSTSDGELLFYLMPAEFQEAQLARTTNRLANIVGCAELCDLDVEACEFSFSRYQLVVRHFAGGMLCVMVEAPVSRRALSMAMRLALQSLPEIVVEMVSDDGMNDDAVSLDDDAPKQHAYPFDQPRFPADLAAKPSTSISQVQALREK
jgi:hypothetical protein